MVAPAADQRWLASQGNGLAASEWAVSEWAGSDDPALRGRGFAAEMSTVMLPSSLAGGEQMARDSTPQVSDNEAASRIGSTPVRQREVTLRCVFFWTLAFLRVL